MSKEKSVGETPANRNYKDTVFRMLFKDRERLLGLYNAVSGRNYKDPGKLEIVTMENAIYVAMRNDLAFLVDLGLYLYEHQSTNNRNMPLRFLQYVSAEYEKLLAPNDLYRDKLVRIPPPHFLVFYNGTAACPEQQELRLSDAFLTKEEEPELELRVKVLNINGGYNEDLKEQCRTLGEYMQYVTKVRSYAKDMPIEEAVDRAVEESIRQGILREFLLQNKAEVTKMSIFEYDDEAVKQALKEDAYEDGKADGIEQGRAEGIEQGRAEGIEQGIEQGIAKGIIETALEFGLSESAILEKLQQKMNVSLEKAQEYFAMFGKQLA